MTDEATASPAISDTPYTACSQCGGELVPTEFGPHDLWRNGWRMPATPFPEGMVVACCVGCDWPMPSPAQIKELDRLAWDRQAEMMAAKRPCPTCRAEYVSYRDGNRPRRFQEHSVPDTWTVIGCPNGHVFPEADQIEELEAIAAERREKEKADAENRKARRATVSKRTRFEIFKRDGFRCVYCGRDPTQGPLHVDHVKPVKEGGTNDPDNLVAACGDCNLGKSAVPLDKKKFQTGKVGEEDRDHAEQIREYLTIQRQVREAMNALADDAIAHWERFMGECPDPMPARLPRLIKELGIDKVCEAIEITAAKQLSEYASVRYFHGVLRKFREGN